MSGVIQPTGVYGNLYTRPAQSGSVMPAASSVSVSVNPPQTAAPALEPSSDKKKPSLTATAIMLFAATTAAVWGISRMAERLEESVKVNDFIKKVKSKHVQTALKHMKNGFIRFGKGIRNSLKFRFQNMMKKNFDYTLKKEPKDMQNLHLFGGLFDADEAFLI